MKKALAILMVVLLAGTLTVSAQLHVDRSYKLKVGLTAGINITKMTVTRSEMKSYVNRTRGGFTAGPTLALFSPVGGLGGDLSVLFDMRSAKSKDGIGRPVKSLSMEMPLNLSYAFNFHSVAMPFIFAGPQVGVNVGRVEHIIAYGTGATTGHDMLRKWVNYKTNVSLNMGVGVLALEKLMVRIGYNLPLKKSGEFQQLDLETGEMAFRGTGKMGSCQVMLTYLF